MSTTLLRTPAVPSLPIAPNEYGQAYQDQYTNSLRLYFNQLNNLNQAVAQRVTTTGILFPDGTEQTTAYIPGYIEVYDRSASIALTSTPTLLKPATTGVNSGITYDATTGEFTWEYGGSFALSLVVNAIASAAGQYVYIYAQNNTGSGWVNNANSGKIYQLPNSQSVQIVYSQAVARTAGQKVRYYIYSNDGKVTLETSTMPGISPTVYVPAIRIQYAG